MDRLERTRREFERLAQCGLDREALFRRAAELLQGVVPFDGGCWHTLDPATLLITSHWTNLSGDGFPMIVANEYGQADVGKFAALAGRRLPAVALSEEIAGGSLRFLAYRARGWGSELRASFDLEGETWGAVMLLRGRDLAPFTEAEARIVARLGRQLACALRLSIAVSAAGADGVAPDGPGLVVLDAADELEAVTVAATGWLGELERTALPPALLSVAAKARATSGPARARVRSATGRWLLLQGSPLGAGGGRVAVVVEPARSVEVAPLLASAYGLTAREREVLREVLHGRSTKQIAASLSVAPYTVQDHLKSIFAKTGSGSRSELVARLFFEHFEPRLGDPLGSDGSFAG
jgi:DNA-binding CsgD family transcriptional regulator